MTDYLEEQKNELEALESIYSEELIILSREPTASFQLSLETQVDKPDIENAAICVKFSLPPNYPDEVSDIEIISSSALEENHIEELIQMMKNIAEENIGMVTTFVVVSALQEKLIEIVEGVSENKRNEEERKRHELEEAERKRFEGTKVTIESFLAWKTKFDDEMVEMKKSKVKEDPNTRKLTGLELFMKDHAMDDSDVKFLEEGGEVVEVDESLFQDIDALDIDGEDACNFIDLNDE